MGICKCAQRKVTNLFCFEHRVNVCEFCMIRDHESVSPCLIQSSCAYFEQCMVKSFLQWLKDSKYKPLCSLCGCQFAETNYRPTVRLLCLDVFHQECLNNYCVKYPINTTEAGYECPSCKFPILPLSNKGGPLAEQLKAFVRIACWLPKGSSLDSLRNLEKDSHGHELHLEDLEYHEKEKPAIMESSSRHQAVHVRIEEPTEDRYQRRSISVLLRRITLNVYGWKFFFLSARKRTKIYFLLFVFCILIVIMTLLKRLGNYATRDDPSFDPLNNPNIRIEQ